MVASTKKEDVKLTFVHDRSAQFDENGIEYVDDKEQKEIESIVDDIDFRGSIY